MLIFHVRSCPYPCLCGEPIINQPALVVCIPKGGTDWTSVPVHRACLQDVVNELEKVVAK